MYLYIYIYIEREIHSVCVYIYIYIYIYRRQAELRLGARSTQIQPRETGASTTTTTTTTTTSTTSITITITLTRIAFRITHRPHSDSGRGQARRGPPWSRSRPETECGRCVMRNAILVRVIVIVIVLVIVMVIVIVIVIVVVSGRGQARRGPRWSRSRAPGPSNVNSRSAAVSRSGHSRRRNPRVERSGGSPWHGGSAVGFHNFNLIIFNLRVSNPNKSIVDVFVDAMSDFNVPGSRPNKNTMKFRKSTVGHQTLMFCRGRAKGVGA